MYLLTAVMLWNLRKDVIKTVYFHPLRIFRKIVSMVGENRKGGIQKRGNPKPKGYSSHCYYGGGTF